MDVELVRWPQDQARLDEVRRNRSARLILVENSTSPPLLADDLEDWVRLPASDEDISLRLRVLAERAMVSGSREPLIDESGLVRFLGKWAALPPVEHRLTSALLDRYGAVVGREALFRAGWPGGIPGRNVLDVHIVRLRRRLIPLGLAIRTVRSRGYLLEEDGRRSNA
jgi:DNA-binding response OmpR family regulator